MENNILAIAIGISFYAYFYGVCLLLDETFRLFFPAWWEEYSAIYQAMMRGGYGQFSS